MSKFSEFDQARSKLIQRLTTEGRFADFNKIRQSLANGGFAVHDSFAIASNLMPPEDGSPCEFEDKLTNSPDLSAKVATILSSDANAFAKSEPKKAKTIPAEGLFSPNASWDSLVDMVEPSRRAPQTAIVDWCFNNVLNRPSDLDPEEIPCRGAIALLRKSRTPAGYSELIALWAKTFPTGQQLKANSNFGDDGRKQLDMLDEFLDSLEHEDGPAIDEEVSERPAQERAGETVVDPESQG